MLSWHFHHAKNALQNVSDRTLVLSESQGAHAKQTTDALIVLQNKMESYDSLIQAMRATQPEVDLVYVHIKHSLRLKVVLFHP